MLPFVFHGLTMLYIAAPLFGAIGASLGIAPIFWTCAMLLGGGSILNRRRKN